jgi:hypothetical protein
VKNWSLAAKTTRDLVEQSHNIQCRRLGNAQRRRLVGKGLAAAHAARPLRRAADQTSIFLTDEAVKALPLLLAWPRANSSAEISRNDIAWPR